MNDMSKKVVLLRGVNVGGEEVIEMSHLKEAFESLGYKNVETYINSGNVILNSDKDRQTVALEAAEIMKDKFDLETDAIVFSAQRFLEINEAAPAGWKNNNKVKTNVLFLSDEIDSEETIEKLKTRKVDKTIYFPGAIIWHIEKSKYFKSGVSKLPKSNLYSKMIVKNVNTLRKISALLSEK